MKTSAENRTKIANRANRPGQDGKGRPAKGDFTYHRRETLRAGILAAAMLVLSVSVYFAALWYFKTNQNLFTIMAVLFVLPAAKVLVRWIMLLRAGECSEELAEEIRQHTGKLENAYNLYFTSEKENFNIRHLAVADRSIAAYTEDPRCDTAAGERHLRRMLTGNGIHGYRIKIFTDRKAYLTRLDQLQALEGTEGADHERMWALLDQISL